MKITFTLEEAKNICRRWLEERLGETVEVNIIVGEMFNLTAWAEKVLTAINKLRYLSDEKIWAIKDLREYSKELPVGTFFNKVMGLADAKYAIENFHEFISFINSNGRLPKEGYNYGFK